MFIFQLFEIFFWVSVSIVSHTYIIYPILVRVLAIGKKPNDIIFSSHELPKVTIIMAAHNEEKVILEKINSVFSGNYPKDQLEFLIGTDNCSDATVQIIQELQKSYQQIKLHDFKERQGKITIVNELTERAKHEVLILTDANVIFDSDTIMQLIQHFKNEQIGLVDSRMKNTGLNINGISIQEKTYINMEVGTKNAEGKLWGAMMGPFGGCFAIRKKAFSKIPNHFLVDDFYLNMEVLRKGYHCINESRAIAYEDVSNELAEEFRRKTRIATGNFQNLALFSNMLFRFNGIAFAFLSHKVFRWITPFLLISALISAFLLISINMIYVQASIFIIILLLFVIFDLVLSKFKVNVSFFRFFTHFFAMNLALIKGFFIYINGVKSSIWEPTKRLQ